MPRYTVRLQVHTTRPLTQAQLDELDGGRHPLTADGRPRSSTLHVDLEMTGGDVAGALARSLNLVLDQVPGEVRHAEITELRQQRSTSRTRPRSR